MFRRPALVVLPEAPDLTERAEALLGASEQAEFAALRYPKRRRDWLLGRLAAKLALAAATEGRVGPEAFTLRKLPDGRPAFSGPEPASGWDLSISHGHGRAAALVGPAPVGVDLEAARNIEPDGWRFFATPAERERLADGELAPVALWAIKEAGFKALHGAVTGVRHLELSEAGHLASAAGALRVRHVLTDAWCLAVATPASDEAAWLDALPLTLL